MSVSTAGGAMSRRLSKKGHEKILTLLRHFSKPCEGPCDGDHSWMQCRRCIAAYELERPHNRALLAALLEGL